jgi:hypothetical protein
MRWHERFTWFERHVAERVGYWAAFILAVGAIMGWIASYIPSFSGSGWATYIYIGFGAACLLSLVLSAALVAWRYFKPLPTPLTPTTARVEVTPNPLANIRLDFLHLTDAAVDQAMVLMLAHLIQQAKLPPVTDDIDSDQPDRGKIWYIRHVSQQLGPGLRQTELNSVLASAQFEAEQKIKELPAQQSAADWSTRRAREIRDLQFSATIRYLNHEKREVERRILAKRNTLIEIFQRYGQSR